MRDRENAIQFQIVARDFVSYEVLRPALGPSSLLFKGYQSMKPTAYKWCQG